MHTWQHIYKEYSYPMKNTQQLYYIRWCITLDLAPFETLLCLYWAAVKQGGVTYNSSLKCQKPSNGVARAFPDIMFELAVIFTLSTCTRYTECRLTAQKEKSAFIIRALIFFLAFFLFIWSSGFEPGYSI